MNTKTTLVVPAYYNLNIQAGWGEECSAFKTQVTPHYFSLSLKVYPLAGEPLTRFKTDFTKWLLRCESCGQAAPDDVEPSIFVAPVMNCDESGQLAPGSMFFQPHSAGKCREWSNCNGFHLNVVLPNHYHWDIDSRASNFGLPDDRTHRCWVRHGDPTKGEPVHFDKSGHTCNAGAGSIQMGEFHGFLHGGEISPC